jgi:hypothetical protein
MGLLTKKQELFMTEQMHLVTILKKNLSKHLIICCLLKGLTGFGGTVVINRVEMMIILVQHLEIF